jgi:hypothetical protein
MCKVKRDGFWFKFQDTIPFEDYGNVQQVNVIMLGQVEFEYTEQLY